MNGQNFGDLSRRDTERHVLVAVDESENSKRLVMYLADFFSGYGDVFITLMTILPEPSEDYFPNDEEREKWLAEKKQTLQKALDGYREILLGAGFKKELIEPRLVVRQCTSIGDAILEEQEKLRCCIVATGPRTLWNRHMPSGRARTGVD